MSEGGPNLLQTASDWGLSWTCAGIVPAARVPSPRWTRSELVVVGLCLAHKGGDGMWISYISPLSFFSHSLLTQNSSYTSTCSSFAFSTTMAAPVYRPPPMYPRRASPRPPTFPGPSLSMDSPIVNVGLGYINRFRQEHLTSLRPFAEFIDTNRFSKPSSIASNVYTQCIQLGHVSL